MIHRIFTMWYHHFGIKSVISESTSASLTNSKFGIINSESGIMNFESGVQFWHRDFLIRFQFKITTSLEFIKPLLGLNLLPNSESRVKVRTSARQKFHWYDLMQIEENSFKIV